MEAFTIEHLTFAYSGRDVPALSDISLSIRKGEFVTLIGQSGCGKSTLLRQLKPPLAPHGKREGDIRFFGEPLYALDARAQAARIGFVLQSPDNQIVTDKVWHELAFGLESLGYRTADIRLRVAEMASFFGIQTWFHKSVTELSGGQKQMLNLAAVMTMQPEVLLLDEPTSQLDPIAASDFLETLAKINRELGTTILISEHRLEEVMPLSDRVVVMDGGKVIADGAPREVGGMLHAAHHPMFRAMPAPMRIRAAVAGDGASSLTVREGREWLDDWARTHSISERLREEPQSEHTEAPILTMKDVWFRYEREAPDVVKGLSLSVYPGELYAIVGGNGTGKSTTLSLMMGLRTPYRGRVTLAGEDVSKRPDAERLGSLIGMLPQNPQSLFVKKTVREDLYEMFGGRKVPKDVQDRKVAAMVRLCELEGLLDAHPFDLSGGEQQRVGLAKVLLLAPRILLLDEPTKGMDAHFGQKFAAILSRLQKAGTTIIMVSHDVGFCAAHADRCAMFFDGGIVTEGPPRAFFSGNSFYTTSSNRMARHRIANAVTVADVIAACGGVPEEPVCPEGPADWDMPAEELDPLPPPPKKRAMSDYQVPVGKRKLPARTVASALMILLFIPLTIWVGVAYLGDRKYYFISLLIILETMLPFFLVFEGRKPEARELVVLSVLCAIAVAGRAAFFMVPQVKPVVALVIITGVCFGGEAGFLVGAVTGFVSNFFFGQGPWTPWQMFAYGVIGFLAGVLFAKGLLRRNKVSLAIFGAFAAFFLFGGIMNPSSVLTYQSQPTWEMFAVAYLNGLPFDLIHAAATAVFLFVAADPMIEKLERIKVKYGMLRPQDMGAQHMHQTAAH